jgi:UDP-N-acetylglucosamine acyltransferase
MNIHSNAIVAKGALIAEGVSIGPFCTVGPDVVLEKGVRLLSHVVIEGKTWIGEDSVIYPFTTIGLPPQDLKYQGEETAVEIGKRNTIRECVTVHRGTSVRGVTRLGDDNLIMVGAHIAHDCRVGNGVILANVVTLAGHVDIGNYSILGGQVGVHQFVRVGDHAMVGAGSMVSQDIVPFSLAVGDRCKIKGLNLVGLKRRGFSKDQLRYLERAFHALFLSKNPLKEALLEIKGEICFVESPSVRALARFIEESERGVARVRD